MRLIDVNYFVKDTIYIVPQNTMRIEFIGFDNIISSYLRSLNSSFAEIADAHKLNIEI